MFDSFDEPKPTEKLNTLPPSRVHATKLAELDLDG